MSEKVLQDSNRPLFIFQKKPGNILLCAGFVAMYAVLLATNPQLLFGGVLEEPLPFQWADAALFFLFAAVSCFFSLVSVNLSQRIKEITGWVFLVLAPALSFIAVDCINTTRIATFHFGTMVANYISYLMVYALVYALCRRVWITALSGGAIFLLFGIANYFTAAFRGSPILPWDFQAIGTAAAVAGGYDFHLTLPMGYAICIWAMFVVLSLRLCPVGKGSTTKKDRMVQRLGALSLSVLLFILIFPVNILSGLGISVWAWNQKTSSQITGITAGFFANVQYLMVEKPEGYSKNTVEELGEEIKALPEAKDLGDPSEKPTIIAIMNESLTDLQRTAGDALTLSQDNLPYLHSLEESGDVIWGTAYSSVYGGNTCNSEYEFLSGNTLSFFPNGCKPYQQYVNCDQTSLVSILEEQGYDTVAIHPGQRTAWHRNTAYPYFGFDSFLDVKLFDVKRSIIHQMTSDLSCYDQVIYEYEHKGDDPLFIFNVTIQNHGGYEDETTATTVQVEGAEGEYPQTEQYLSLTKKSDEALEELIEYFSSQEDPVVILFFGDHWPNLEFGFLTQLFGEDYGVSFEDTMAQRQIPFMLWANYPLEAEEIQSISLNYLSGLLLRAAGVEESPYLKFVETVRQEIPVITADGMMDKDGNWYKTGEDTPYDELLNQYAILQYNQTFGEEIKDMELFTTAASGKKETT